MIRSKEATGKTVEEARAAACAALGVSEDDLNVSYEILEMPQSTGLIFKKKTPAKVRPDLQEKDPCQGARDRRGGGRRARKAGGQGGGQT